MTDEFENESEGIKNLRSQYDKLQKESGEKDKMLADLIRRDRTRTIQDKLGEHGVNPKVATFVPESVELDKLDVWLGENADVFGFNLKQPESPENAAEHAAQQRISGFSGSGSDQNENPDLQAVLTAQSAQDIENLIYAAQVGRR